MVTIDHYFIFLNTVFPVMEVATLSQHVALVADLLTLQSAMILQDLDKTLDLNGIHFNPRESS